MEEESPVHHRSRDAVIQRSELELLLERGSPEPLAAWHRCIACPGPLFCAEVISVFGAAKTYTSSKSTSFQYQNSSGESSGTSEKIILARLPVWKRSLLPNIRGVETPILRKTS